MLHGKKVLFVSPSTSSFTIPVTEALQALDARVINFYDNLPSFPSRLLGFLASYGLSSYDRVKIRSRTDINKALENKLATFSPDILLVIKGIEINKEVIEAANKMGIVSVNWFPDCQGVWEWLKKNASVYQYFFTCCYDLLSQLENIGLRPYYLPYAGQADKQIQNLPKKLKVVFVGQYTKRRERYFKKLIDLGLDIWGYEAWKKSSLAKYYHAHLPVEEMKNIFRQSKIVVNMTTSESDNGFVAANLRNFEVTAVSAFLLTQGNVAIKRLFDDGEEVVCFDDPENLRKKVLYFLEHDKERGKIARAGWERVRKDHTYEQRLREMFQLIEKS